VFDAIHRRIEAPDGRAVELTQGQHRLLAALLARPGEVVSREELLGAVLGEETDSFDRAIDVHVSRLKKRLAQVIDADLIKSYRGVGYRMDVRQIVQ
jgi:two-component system OmpR family response regulator